MEIDRLAADLPRLGNKSVSADLRTCVIIVAGLCANYEIVENNSDGHIRAEIEHVVGNQYNRLLRRQQESASKGSVMVDHGKGKNRRPHQKFEGNCYGSGKKCHRAVDCKRTKNEKL